jgi:hypothetical protein
VVVVLDEAFSPFTSASPFVNIGRMPHWLIKSAVHRALSLLPASHLWNAWFQKYVTRSLDLTRQRFRFRLECCRRHLESFFELRPRRGGGFTVFELGTGWFPVVPIGLYLCGASEVWTFDIAPLLSGRRLRQAFELFDEFDRSGELRCFLPLLQSDRLTSLRQAACAPGPASAAERLQRLDIQVRTQDAAQTGLPSATVDLFVSTGVLEYIPVPAIEQILAEFRRVGSPDAVQSHYLNLADEYSYFDPSITPFNFLRFSERRWKYLNSPLAWLNRLRVPDYRRLFDRAGFEIIKEFNTSGRLEDLKKIQLAPEFRSYREEDLLVLASWLTVQPQRRPPNGS